MTATAIETREMVEVTDRDGRVVDLLPLGHRSLKEYEASEKFRVHVIAIWVDERGRRVG